MRRAYETRCSSDLARLAQPAQRGDVQIVDPRQVVVGQHGLDARGHPLVEPVLAHPLAHAMPPGPVAGGTVPPLVSIDPQHAGLEPATQP